MKRLSVLSILLMCPLTLLEGKTPQDAFPGVEGLIRRMIPRHAGEFVVDSIAAESGKEVFEIDTVSGKIALRSSSPSGAAFALNYYLKYICHCSVSRMGENLNLPDKLPCPEQMIRRETASRYRYFLNYCTFNYSMSWYTWKDWEKELDWMALNGINLALAVTGTEKVWQDVLRTFAFTEDEIRAFLPGPAYTAWWLMGNIEKWRGPVSQQYIDDRATLQKKIVARMRELGISPVLQGFYGAVPTRLKEIFPNHHIVDQGFFGGDFQRPDILDPTDTLFGRMAEAYYRALTRLYGTSGFYGGDPFHEGGSTQGIDVRRAAGDIQREMLKADPSAVWVLQGWQENPKDELLAGVDKTRILVLDLNAESSPQWETRKAYGGSPWLWCNILYYGDNTFMYGKLDSVVKAPLRALKTPYGQYMKGIGFLMEGFDNDPVNYDLFFESPWHAGNLDVGDWLHGFVTYRYGKSIPSAQQAWQILYRTVYTAPAPADPIVCARPAENVDRVVTWSSSKIWIDNKLLGKAAQDLLDCAGELNNVDTYEYDLVSVTRQYISNVAHRFYAESMRAYRQKDAERFRRYSHLFMDVVYDLDTLLSCRREYLLGAWIDRARKLGEAVGQEDLFELNARTLITLWGDRKASEMLHDYSFREWAGMLSGFYGPRWRMFFDGCEASIEGKAAPAIDFYPWEDRWCHGKEKYPSEPRGDAVVISGRLLSKYLMLDDQ